MNIRTAAAFRRLAVEAADGSDRMKNGPGAGGTGGDAEAPPPDTIPNPAVSKVRGGAFGRLVPVHQQRHGELTKGGYKHTANYETSTGTGRFGYYEHPATGHRVTLDEMGNCQDEMPVQQGRGGGGGGGQRGFGGGGMQRSGGGGMGRF